MLSEEIKHQINERACKECKSSYNYDATANYLVLPKMRKQKSKSA